jgi:hypothetical protein
MSELTQEQKTQRLQTILKIVGAGLVCLVVSPIIFGVIQGAIGLLIAGAVGFTAIQFTPWFSLKIANLAMKAMTSEARNNPIETMTVIYKDNMRVISEKDEKIVQFSARLADYKSKMIGFSQRYPEEAASYQEAADKMARVLQRQKQKQLAAKQAAKLYYDQIQKADAIWQMALEANGLQKLAGSIEKQVNQDIMKRVSFDSVTHSFNTAVAELSVEADTDPDTILTSGSYPNLQAVVEAKASPQGRTA